MLIENRNVNVTQTLWTEIHECILGFVWEGVGNDDLHLAVIYLHIYVAEYTEGMINHCHNHKPLIKDEKNKQSFGFGGEGW